MNTNDSQREFVQAEPRFFGRARAYCYVRPRYSPGSPAMVHDHIALQVARDERESYEHALTGMWGEAEKKRAEILGLRGTAYVMAEKGSGKNFRWLIQDLVTSELLRRHHDQQIETMGFKRFAELPEHTRREINKTGRDSDYERTFWTFEELRWRAYEPEVVHLEGRTP